MKVTQGEVVTVVTMMGEIIGKVTENTKDSITLEKPRLFVPGESGKGGFAPGVCMTGEGEPEELEFQLGSVLTVTKTHADIAKGYTEMTTGIALA